MQAKGVFETRPPNCGVPEQDGADGERRPWGFLDLSGWSSILPRVPPPITLLRICRRWGLLHMNAQHAVAICALWVIIER